MALVALAMLTGACADSAPDGPLAASPGVARSELDPAAPVAELAVGFNQAGFDLWRTQPVEGNLVFSPVSIGHALLMARGAADQTTGAAIDAALMLPAGRGAHEAWNWVDQRLAANAAQQEELTLRVADRIWPRIGLTPDQEWVDLLIAEHGVSVEPLDFTGDTAGSRDAINAWVAERTNELIPELLPADFIDPATELVLTDAIYFEARWQRVFGKYGQEVGEFTRRDGSTVTVEYLVDLEMGQFPHGRGDGFDFLSLPYVGERFSMLLIVPDSGRFDQVRAGLDQTSLDVIDESGITGPLELHMPEWMTNTTIDLMSWLREIGAAPGSYPGIHPGAFLDAAVHGADIAVDDYGTVAAAATAFGFPESGPPEPEMVIHANRPFLYLIRDHEAGIVLFAGQVTDPTS